MRLWAAEGLEGGLSTSLNIVVLLTVLAIVPSVFILCTSARLSGRIDPDGWVASDEPNRQDLPKIHRNPRRIQEMSFIEFA